MKTKKCSRCGEIKEANLINFKSDKRTKGKLTSWCRKCKWPTDRIYSRKYREDHPEWKKQDNEKHKELVNRLVKEYNKKYPDRQKANHLVNYAIKKWKIKRGKCVVNRNCSKENRVIDAHHPDYKYPLRIVWICHKHHKQFDAGIIKIEPEKLIVVDIGKLIKINTKK